MTGTNFTSRQCWQPREQEGAASEAEQLQNACWNGLLKDMLPEIYTGNQKLYLWQIKENRSSIDIELGELPGEVDSYFSIDPYAYLEAQSMN